MDEAVKRWLAVRETDGPSSCLFTEQQTTADAMLRVAASLSSAAQPLYMQIFLAIAQEKEGIEMQIF